MLGFGVGFTSQTERSRQHRLSAILINYRTAKIHPWWWRLYLGLAGVPALGSFTLPDTLGSVIERRQMEKARAVLQRIRGTPDVQEELEDLIEATEISKRFKHPFRNITRKKYRPQLLMALAIPFVQ